MRMSIPLIYTFFIWKGLRIVSSLVVNDDISHGFEVCVDKESKFTENWRKIEFFNANESEKEETSCK